MSYLIITLRTIFIALSAAMLFVIGYLWNTQLDTGHQYDKVYQLTTYIVLLIYSQVLHTKFNFAMLYVFVIVNTAMSIVAMTMASNVAIMWVTISVWMLMILYTIIAMVCKMNDKDPLMSEIWA